VQDAYLNGEISEDGLTRAFTHMSIRCNPGAPKEVPTDVMKQLLAAAPDIVELEQQVKESSTRLRCEYVCISQALTLEQNGHAELRSQLKNAKKGFKSEMNDAYRKDYFYRIHNEMMQRQLQRNLDAGEDEDAEEPDPPADHQLTERMCVQQLLCDLTRDLSPQDVVSRKILAIDAMTSLASRQEPQTRKPKSVLASEDPLKKEPLCSAPSPDPSTQSDKILLILGKTQCIFCIGNERFTYEKQTRAFKRVSHMWDHVENLHLKYHGPMIPCPHPVCMAQDLILNSMMTFKNHVVTIHGVELRPCKVEVSF
jgi:hypothetical protein